MEPPPDLTEASKSEVGQEHAKDGPALPAKKPVPQQQALTLSEDTTTAEDEITEAEKAVKNKEGHAAVGNEKTSTGPAEDSELDQKNGEEGPIVAEADIVRGTVPTSPNAGGEAQIPVNEHPGEVEKITKQGAFHSTVDESTQMHDVAPLTKNEGSSTAKEVMTGQAAGEEKSQTRDVHVDNLGRSGVSQVSTGEPTEGSLISEEALKSHPTVDDDQILKFDQAGPEYVPDGTQSDASSFSAVAGLDVDTSDSDSAIGSMNAWSSTQSARSSVYDFIEENGRKYHRFREGRYHLPNDEIEQDRLDLQHHLFRLTLGSLYLAPLKDLPGGLHHALDIATGTGIWAIEFANEFPQTSVLGMDLSPIQPDFVPPNCSFEVDDADDEWLYSHQFDYIHGRALAACFKSHQAVFDSAFKFIRPGGYFEIQDVALPVRGLDDTFPNSAFNKWQNLAISGGAALGRDFTLVPKYKSYFEAAGFVDIVEKRFVWPLGTWPKGKKMKVLGSWAREDILSAMQGVSMAVMTRGLGMTPDEVELSLVEARDDLKSNKVHMYMAVYVVYGRKPE